MTIIKSDFRNANFVGYFSCFQRFAADQKQTIVVVAHRFPAELIFSALGMKAMGTYISGEFPSRVVLDG